MKIMEKFCLEEKGKEGLSLKRGYIIIKKLAYDDNYREGIICQRNPII